MIDVTIVPVTPFQQNCTLLRCAATGKGAVCDPGGEVDRLVREIEARDIDVETVLLTHGHVDHASGAAELAERLDVPIVGPHREDLFWLEGLPDQARMFGFEGDVRVPRIDRWLEGGDTARFGDAELEVKHCPGHTPGHVVFFHRPGMLALVGDVIFQGSIGRTDFPRGDFDTLIRSIREELLPLGDDVRFVCGHGPNSTFGHERRTNPFLLDPDRFRGLV